MNILDHRIEEVGQDSEKRRILRLAIATFIVDTNRTIQELNATGAHGMATALEAEVHTASKLLVMFR